MIRLAGWLTPTTACALLTLLVLNSENAVPAGGHRQPAIMAMMSNQNYAVSMPPAASPSKTICPSLLLIGQTAAVRVSLATFRS